MFHATIKGILTQYKMMQGKQQDTRKCNQIKNMCAKPKFNAI